MEANENELWAGNRGGLVLFDLEKEKIQLPQSLMVSYCRTSCFIMVMVVLTISILVLPLVLPPLPPPPLILLFVPLMILSLLVLLALRSSQMPNMDTTSAVWLQILISLLSLLRSLVSLYRAFWWFIQENWPDIYLCCKIKSVHQDYAWYIISLVVFLALNPSQTFFWFCILLLINQFMRWF